jgi:hypothetical protein
MVVEISNTSFLMILPAFVQKRKLSFNNKLLIILIINDSSLSGNSIRDAVRSIILEGNLCPYKVFCKNFVG